MEKGQVSIDEISKDMENTFSHFQLIFIGVKTATGRNSYSFPKLSLSRKYLYIFRYLKESLVLGLFNFPFLVFCAQHIFCLSICREQSKDKSCTGFLRVVLPKKRTRGHQHHSQLERLLQCNSEASESNNSESTEVRSWNLHFKTSS